MDKALYIYNYCIAAIGCPDIVPPRNAWLKKDKDGVTVGCHSNSQEWEMKCVGKHWIGTAGNCSVVGGCP